MGDHAFVCLFRVLLRLLRPYRAGHLELLRCYYNFVRPHMALRFGRDVRTPAMQAGLVAKRLTFRDVFTAVVTFFSFLALLIRLRCWRQVLISRCVAVW